MGVASKASIGISKQKDKGNPQKDVSVIMPCAVAFTNIRTYVKFKI